jgi:hypothetical protein
MTPRAIILPLYILDDIDLARLIGKAEEIMTELAGESDTSELPPLIGALRAEVARRGQPVSAADITVPPSPGAKGSH